MNLFCMSDLTEDQYFYSPTNDCIIYNEYTKINLYHGIKDHLFAILHEQGHCSHFNSLSPQEKYKYINSLISCNTSGIDTPDVLCYEIKAWEFAFMCTKISVHEELKKYALKYLTVHILRSTEKERIDIWFNIAKTVWNKY